MSGTNPPSAEQAPGPAPGGNAGPPGRSQSDMGQGRICWPYFLIFARTNTGSDRPHSGELRSLVLSAAVVESDLTKRIMLQRIQTVHLLIVVALMAVMFFPNYATVKMGAPLPAGTVETVGADSTITRVVVPAGVEEEITFNLWGIYQNGQKAVPTTYMAVLVVLTLVLAFATVFLYRKRWIQVRLCFAMAIMLLGIEAFIALYIYKLKEILDTMMRDYAVKYSVADVLPLVALVFVYFAFRGVSKDIALIKSLDRIR